MKRCYYEILGIEKSATLAEIKKAYKTQALKHHPDKNQNKEEATQTFTIIQQAYQVLSDEHERYFYDNHREAILRGDEERTDVDLMPFFSSEAYSFLDDAVDGFYTVYRELFMKLDSLEEVASKISFGRSDSALKEVKQFYAHWSGFSTTRSFAFADKYNLATADGRRMRRQMEKENKKLRDIEKKEYNENIRELVKFIKKRDQRLKTEKPNNKLEKKSQRVETKTFEYFEQDWAKVKELDIELDEIDDLHEFHCPVCNKIFKSEKQLENHESSKKHRIALENLRRELELDDELFAESESEEFYSLEEDSFEEMIDETESNNDSKNEEVQVISSDEDEKLDEPKVISLDEKQEPLLESKEEKKKKRKEARKLKKNKLRCNVCSVVFPSRTKLFNHIREKGHQQA